MAKRKSTKKSSPKKRWRSVAQPLISAFATMIIVTLLLVIGYFGYEYTYTNKVFAGVVIGGKDIGGMNYTEAARVITDYKTQFESDGLTFTYGDHALNVPLNDEDGESVLLVEVFTDATLHKAFGIGRSDNPWKNLNDKLTALLNGEAVSVVATIQTETLAEILSTEFDGYATPYQNAALEFSDDEITVSDHTDGTSFRWASALEEINQRVQHLEPLTFRLTLEPEPAPITRTLAEATIPQAERIVALAPLSLTYEGKTYNIERDELESWLTIVRSGDTVEVAFDEESVDGSLDAIAGEVDIPVQEGRFSLDIVDGEVKLQQFQEGRDGLAVQVKKTIAAIEEVLFKNSVTTIPLVVEVTKPRATPDNIDELGIQELLGTGETNFAGSPANRVANIYKGAEMLNGLLIAPDETFSLLSVLSPIDLEHGWLSELVIKGDKLEKEAGGGLCQIGTTSFRAAMMSGLPIVERRNHSWAVSYYNYNGKAGVDATIYEPSPDFQFKNDTGHYILWRSRIEGADIYFELWGTSDGRKGYFMEPVNYAYVSPGLAEEVVDESLPPGTRNCVQHAYTGVSASFDYIIERADGKKDVQTFTSVFKARPERCLVGPPEEGEKEESTEEAETTDTADSTDSAETTDNTNDSSTKKSNKNSKKKN